MAATDRTMLARLRERLRYGLATQEALDRLARLGVIFYPYYFVVERAGDVPIDGDTSGLSFCRLGPDHAPQIAAMPCRPRRTQRVLELMQNTSCYGVFDGDTLVAYSWVDFASVRSPMTTTVLFALDARSAYGFDMYVARTHRGHRLAPWLRHCVYTELNAAGRDTFYSITLAYNQSSRRFKQRLGAVEIEKRLLIGSKSLAAYDVRLRALTEDPLPTPKTLRIRGWVSLG